MFTSNYGEPKSQWVAYDNGSYEPVDRKGDLRYKSRSRNDPDWWVEDKSPDWRPEKYAKTKRGQKAKQELGYTSSTEATNKNPIERANPMRPTFIQEDTDHNAPSLPKTTWSLSKQYPSLFGGGFDEKIAGMVKQNMSQQNVARQTQQDTPQKQSAMTQPQHENTGHATAQLGGTEDGKVTVVREGQDSARGNASTATQSQNDLLKDEVWEKIELPGVGATYLHKDVKEAVEKWQELNKQSGIPITFTCGFRTTEKQRSKKIQNSSYGAAAPGTSLHEAGRAVDVAIKKGESKPIGITQKQWEEAIENAKKAGLSWGGNFRKDKDEVHFYMEVPEGRENRDKWIKEAQKRYKHWE